MDLTSENILFNCDGSVKLAGFSNIATKNSDSLNSNLYRTIFYVAPEIARFILNQSEIFITGKIDVNKVVFLNIFLKFLFNTRFGLLESYFLK